MKHLLTPILAAMTFTAFAAQSPTAAVPPVRAVPDEAWPERLRQFQNEAQKVVDRTLAQAEQALQEAPKLLAQSVGAVRRERARNLPVRPIRTLVAAPSLKDPKQISELEEDLAVMCRLLAKDVEFEVQNDANRAMGIVISSIADSAMPPEALYLEGFGAFFYLNVGFPLLPPKAEKPDKPDVAPMDSDWDRARAELFGKQTPDITPRANVFLGGADQAPPPAYEEEKVEDLKRVLLSSLRNALNIRGLKPADWIHVSVASFPRGRGGMLNVGVAQMTMTYVQDGKTVTRTYGPQESGRNGVLNIRIKRSDLDDYAKGKLSLEDLRKRASISVY